MREITIGTKKSKKRVKRVSVFTTFHQGPSQKGIFLLDSYNGHRKPITDNSVSNPTTSIHWERKHNDTGLSYSAAFLQMRMKRLSEI